MNRTKKGMLYALCGGLAGLLLAGWVREPLLLREGAAGGPLTEQLGAAGASLVLALLMAALGAAVGTAALPFAQTGRALVLQSLGHFSLTALLTLLWFRLCLQVQRPAWLAGWLGILALLYLLIWLGRYVGWYWEAADLRRCLGLSPGPSLLKWRETLVYLPFLLLACVGVPLLARWVDGTFVVDVPVFSALLVPFVVQPVTGFCSGWSLGRRQGVCPLYPLAGAALYVPVLLLAYHSTAWFHSLLFALPALAGMAAGQLGRRRREKS